jgi:hypothetical protein
MPVSIFGDIGTGKSLAVSAVSDSSDIGEVKLEDDSLEVELVLTDSTFENNSDISSYGLTAYEDLGKGSGNSNSGNNSTSNDYEGVNEEEPDPTIDEVVKNDELIPPRPVGLPGQNTVGSSTTPAPPASAPPSTPVTVSCELPEEQTGGSISIPPPSGNQIITAPGVSRYPIPRPSGNPINPSSAQIAPNPPKGKKFFEPECDTCCHSPTDSPQQFYTLCLLISTDPMVTRMIEGGMIDQVYSSIPVLQGKFEAGNPGAHLQEISFMDMSNSKVESLVNSSLFVNPIVMARAEPVLGGVVPVMPTVARAYQFQRRFKFKIPRNAKHITLFNFIRFDELAFNQHYQIPNFTLPSGVYTGPIKELIVVHNGKVRTKGTTYVSLGQSTRGQQVTTPIQLTPTGLTTFVPGLPSASVPVVKVVSPIGNIQNSNIFNKLISFCSDNIYSSITRYNSSVKNTNVPYKFYNSNVSQDTLSTYLIYDHAKMISDNSFIKNLQIGEFYANQPILAAEFYKADALDASKQVKINETRSSSPKGKMPFLRQNTYYSQNPLPDDTTVDKQGNRAFLSKFRELPNLSRGIRALQLLDKTYTSGEYYYSVNFLFEDPSVVFLRTYTKELENSVVALEAMYENLYVNRKAIKDGKIEAQKVFSLIKKEFKKVLALSNKILKILPNDGFNSAIYLDYMISLGNPKTSNDKNSMFFRILNTLVETMKDLLSSSGGQTDTLVDLNRARNGLSKTTRRNSIRSIGIKSEVFYKKSDFGVDFLSMSQASTKDNTYLSTKDISDRGTQELKKFWTSESGFGQTEASIKQKATFYLTPNRIIGVDEIIDFSSIPGFDEALKEKVKKTSVIAEGKPTKKSSFFTTLESLSNLPASFQMTDSAFDFTTSDLESNNVFDLADVYLKEQSNFKSENINTVNNSIRQSTEFTGKMEEMLNSVEDTFVNGINKIGSTDYPTIAKNIEEFSLSQLPPSLQSYRLRNLPASRFNQFVQVFGDLTSPSNIVFLQNLFGIVVKIQFALLRPDNLNSLEWADLDLATIQRNKILFCRLLPVYIEEVGVDPTSIQSMIYNEYFILRSETLFDAIRSSPNLIRPQNSIGVKTTINLEKAIDDKLEAIMGQKTTYNSGAPIVYSKIIH